MKTASLIAVLAVALFASTLAPTAIAQEQVYINGPAVIVRDTIPYPRAIDRQPLTYDRLSTTSTRLVDARRGFRPYSSVHGTGGGCACGLGHSENYVRGYDDNFGISRFSDRPFSYVNRTLRTGVTEHRNPLLAKKKADNAEDKDVVIRVQMDPKKTMDAYKPKPRKGVTVHRNKKVKPVRIETRRPVKGNVGFTKADGSKDAVAVFRSADLPQASGAVLVAPDGTIYTIGN